MHTSPNTSDSRPAAAADCVWAALMFFTRLPFWRVRQVDAACFRHVVDYWPFVGWLTGGTAALVFWLITGHVPPLAAALLAVGARLCLTGALHEDGLADFCDGFGGGTDRARTLAIMKDSHIGTYGVLGLVLHTGLLVTLMATLPAPVAPAAILAADVYGKSCASFIIRQLPYARTAEQAKSGVVYATWNRRTLTLHLLRCLIALAPGLCWLLTRPMPFPYWAFAVPILTELLLTAWIRRRLQGYTGDCCGATFLLCELASYLGLHLLLTFTPSI